MSEPNRPLAKGRGSQIEPVNRFGGTYREIDFDQLEHDDDYLASLRNRPTDRVSARPLEDDRLRNDRLELV